jgi:hypothetical protein
LADVIGRKRGNKKENNLAEHPAVLLRSIEGR